MMALGPLGTQNPSHINGGGGVRFNAQDLLGTSGYCQKLFTTSTVEILLIHQTLKNILHLPGPRKGIPKNKHQSQVNKRHS